MKMYLEMVKSDFRRGTSMRSKSVSYIEYNIESDTDENIYKVLDTLDNDVLIGMEYNNAMVGTDYHRTQYHVTRIYVETSEESNTYKLYLLEYKLYFENNIRIIRYVFHNDKYSPVMSNSNVDKEHVLGFTRV